MTAYGADPDALRRLAQQLEQAAQQMTQLGRQTSTALRGSSWKGPDADAVRTEWDSTHTATVTKAVQAVSDAAKALVRNADEQTRTSSVDGGSGTPGVVPPWENNPILPPGTVVIGGPVDGGVGNDGPSGHGGGSVTVNGATAQANGSYEVDPTGAGAQGDASVTGTIHTPGGDVTSTLDAQGSVHAGLTGHYNGPGDFQGTLGNEAQAGASATTTYDDPTGHVSAEVDAQASAQAGGHVSVQSSDGGVTGNGSFGVNAGVGVGGSQTVSGGGFSLGGGAHAGVGAGFGYSGDFSATPNDVGIDITSGLGLGPHLDGSLSFHIDPIKLAGELSTGYHSTISAFTPVAHTLGDLGSDLGHGISGGLSAVGSVLGGL